jgi:DNA-binding transcriptional MerR regulator
MSTEQNATKTYTIREAARVSGLPESTLRYHETIELISPIQRDSSSKYRVYSEDDVNLIVVIACLNATGLSIEDMRQYLRNRDLGSEGAHGQVQLLEVRRHHLEDEVHYMQLRLKYVQSKIAFWEAVETGDEEQIETARVNTHARAQEMKLPKLVSRESSDS